LHIKHDTVDFIGLITLISRSGLPNPCSYHYN